IAIVAAEAPPVPADTASSMDAPAASPIAFPGAESLQELQRQPRFEPPAPAVPGSVAPPALSSAITRRLAGVVPANMQLDAPWAAVHAARESAKAAGEATSPSLMLAWCVARAMQRHPAFCRLVLRDGTIVEQTNPDLGIAVALEQDRLGTAVLH